MCLYILKTDVPTVADDDIVVYKIVMELKNSKGIFRGPFREEYSYAVNERLNSPLNRKPLGHLLPPAHGMLQLDTIHNGFHSFLTEEDAYKALVNLYLFTDSSEKRYHVLKCRIPKGANYFLGTFSKFSSYASDSLIIDYQKLTLSQRIKSFWCRIKNS